jgi:hypothetical protein
MKRFLLTTTVLVATAIPALAMDSIQYQAISIAQAQEAEARARFDRDVDWCYAHLNTEKEREPCWRHAQWQYRSTARATEEQFCATPGAKNWGPVYCRYPDMMINPGPEPAPGGVEAPKPAPAPTAEDVCAVWRAAHRDPLAGGGGREWERMYKKCVAPVAPSVVPLTKLQECIRDAASEFQRSRCSGAEPAAPAPAPTPQAKRESQCLAEATAQRTRALQEWGHGKRSDPGEDTATLLARCLGRQS